MHERRELPGGAMTDAITTVNQRERRWLRPSTSGHDEDPELKQTTVRWYTGPNGAGDPTIGWYTLTHDNGHTPRVAARTGSDTRQTTCPVDCSYCTAPTSTTATC